MRYRLSTDRLIADLVQRGYSRQAIFEAPASQLMLEWDAAMFNDSVEAHDKAMAELTSMINQKAETVDARRHRDKLISQKKKLRDEFVERARLFWHGRKDGA